MVVLCGCIIYILLSKKLPPNIVPLSNISYYLTVSGSGIQHNLAGSSGSGPHKDALRVLPGTVVSSEGVTVGTFFQASSLCCWLKMSVPFHVGLFIGQLRGSQ